jgi:hypothetical protein
MSSTDMEIIEDSIELDGDMTKSAPVEAIFNTTSDPAATLLNRGIIISPAVIFTSSAA